MRIDLRDGIKDELDTKITLTLRWMFRIIFLSLISGAVIFAWIAHQTKSQPLAAEAHILKTFDVARGVSDTSYGTYWKYCGGWFTADHVHEAMNLNAPDFVSKGVVRAPGVIDAVWYGKKWSCGAPTPPIVGTDVYILGYPGGSEKPTLREGKVHFHRVESGSPGYQMGTWIVVFKPREDAGISGEAVATGMSGGIVTDANYNPIGILVTQNSPADLDGDGVIEQSVDIVSLADAYRVLIEN
jgi:hypothetical protein